MAVVVTVASDGVASGESTPSEALATSHSPLVSPTANHQLMPKKPKKSPLRDDAQAQPESGYPDGQLNTKPSAERRNEESRRQQAGSESEFDSEKPRP